MPRIMCTAKLRQALGHSEQLSSNATARVFHGVVLGSWAATVVTIDQRDLVIARNERTFLTLVVALEPAHGGIEHNLPSLEVWHLFAAIGPAERLEIH